MILKIWNDDRQCYSYIDKVREVNKEGYWADTDIETTIPNILYKVYRNDKGNLFINTMCVLNYNKDYRNNKQRTLFNITKQKSSLLDKDTDTSNGIYLTNILSVTYEDDKSEYIVIGNSDNNFILNENGQTIDRL